MGDLDELAGTAVFCSWSGGKDCALALYESIVAGAMPRLLVTMLTEGDTRSRSHGLHRVVLEAQAAAIGVPIRFESATWAGYEPAFQTLVRQATTVGAGHGIFGDIDIEEHRKWVQTACSQAGATPWLPLWQRERHIVMEQLLDAGFQAVIIAVRDGVLAPELLGATIDQTVVHEFARAGIDLAGENGEYHSVVVDGPIFEHPLDLTAGQRSLRDGVWFLDVLPSADLTE